MNVFVCVKQVPDTEARIEVKPDQSGINETGIKWVMNPYDEFAVEEAIKVKEKFPEAKIIAVTLGPKPRSQEVLRTALALGADEAIAVELAANADFSMTAFALAKLIEKEGAPSLIFTGKLAIDDNGSAVGPMLAAKLNIPHATSVVKFEIGADKKVTVEREVEGGSKEILEMTMPCLVGATKGLNTPRYATLPNIMKAKKKPLKEVSGAELVQDSDRRTSFIEFKAPKDKPPVKFLDGDGAKQAQTLVQLLKDEAKIL